MSNQAALKAAEAKVIQMSLLGATKSAIAKALATDLPAEYKVVAAKGVELWIGRVQRAYRDPVTDEPVFATHGDEVEQLRLLDVPELIVKRDHYRGAAEANYKKAAQVEEVCWQVHAVDISDDQRFALGR